jgi:hypothetical protein
MSRSKQPKWIFDRMNGLRAAITKARAENQLHLLRVTRSIAQIDRDLVGGLFPKHTSAADVAPRRHGG